MQSEAAVLLLSRDLESGDLLTKDGLEYRVRRVRISYNEIMTIYKESEEDFK
jgi:hypothetical protein